MFGINQAHAQTNTNPMSGLVDAISQKFNLDKDQVQSVVDQFHAERRTTMQENRQKRIGERLDQAVKDGKITSEQKLAILNKLAELKSKFPPGSFKGMTKDQMKQKIQDHQAEIKAWLQNQGIDPTFLMPFEGMKRGW